MHAAISDKHAAIAALCRIFGVKRLEVFGSAARGTDFDPDRSDADFLVEFDPGVSCDLLGQYFRLKDGLTGILGRKVDLVELGAVRNPYVLEGINEDREVLYAA